MAAPWPDLSRSVLSYPISLQSNEGKKAYKSITVTPNAMITIDAAHQRSHCLSENDWFCLAGVARICMWLYTRLYNNDVCVPFVCVCVFVSVCVHMYVCACVCVCVTSLDQWVCLCVCGFQRVNGLSKKILVINSTICWMPSLSYLPPSLPPSPLPSLLPPSPKPFPSIQQYFNYPGRSVRINTRS